MSADESSIAKMEAKCAIRLQAGRASKKSHVDDVDRSPARTRLESWSLYGGTLVSRGRTHALQNIPTRHCEISRAPPPLRNEYCFLPTLNISFLSEHPIMKKILAALALTCLSTATFAADLAPSCVEYFKQIDTFLGSNPQADALKPQYDAMKKQMADMPVATQDAACKQAADAMKQALANAPVQK